MKGLKMKTLTVFLSAMLVLNAGIFGLSFGAPTTYMVSGLIWDDANANGIRDAGEQKIQDEISIQVVRVGGNFVQFVSTTNGQYSIYLQPGEYEFRFNELYFPDGYFATKRGVGSNGDLDSNGTRPRVFVTDSDVGHIDLGITNKPYNVRVTEKVKVYDYDTPTQVIGNIYRNTIKTVYGREEIVQKYKIWYKGKWGIIPDMSTDYSMIKELQYSVRIKATPNILVYKYSGLQPIGTLPNGTIKTVYGTRLNPFYYDKYYRIWYNGGPAYIKAQDTQKLQYNIRITDKTAVRKYPKGPVLPGNLYKNRIKTAYGYRTDNNGVMWYRVWHNGGPGYVYKLVTSRNLTSVPNFNVKLNYKLTVRSGVWGTTLGTLSKNSIKTVYGQRLDRDGETWYRVWYNGGPGYIRAKYTTRQ